MHGKTAEVPNMLYLSNNFIMYSVWDKVFLSSQTEHSDSTSCTMLIWNGVSLGYNNSAMKIEQNPYVYGSQDHS